MKITSEQVKEATEKLHQLLDQNPRVYSTLKHVSRSGMSRVISFFAVRDNEIICLDWYISRILTSARLDAKERGLKVSGCGMDMGYHVVNNLSQALYCPKKYDHDAAYKLQHSWI